jgi:hypothetical protein
MRNKEEREESLKSRLRQSATAGQAKIVSPNWVGRGLRAEPSCPSFSFSGSGSPGLLRRSGYGGQGGFALPDLRNRLSNMSPNLCRCVLGRVRLWRKRCCMHEEDIDY